MSTSFSKLVIDILSLFFFRYFVYTFHFNRHFVNVFGRDWNNFLIQTKKKQNAFYEASCACLQTLHLHKVPSCPHFRPPVLIFIAHSMKLAGMLCQYYDCKENNRDLILIFLYRILKELHLIGAVYCIHSAAGIVRPTLWSRTFTLRLVGTYFYINLFCYVCRIQNKRNVSVSRWVPWSVSTDYNVYCPVSDSSWMDEPVLGNQNCTLKIKTD